MSVVPLFSDFLPFPWEIRFPRCFGEGRDTRTDSGTECIKVTEETVKNPVKTLKKEEKTKKNNKKQKKKKKKRRKNKYRVSLVTSSRGRGV